MEVRHHLKEEYGTICPMTFWHTKKKLKKDNFLNMPKNCFIELIYFIGLLGNFSTPKL